MHTVAAQAVLADPGGGDPWAGDAVLPAAAALAPNLGRCVCEQGRHRTPHSFSGRPLGNLGDDDVEEEDAVEQHRADNVVQELTVEQHLAEDVVQDLAARAAESGTAAYPPESWTHSKVWRQLGDQEAEAMEQESGCPRRAEGPSDLVRDRR